MVFHPDIITSCPPSDAIDAGRVFRKIDGSSAVAKDFVSDVEAERKYRDPEKCECWGCSVWCDEEAVELALALFPYWKKKSIVVGDLLPGEGVLKKTPSENQPRHHTLWKPHGLDISGRFVVFRAPDGA